MPKNWAVARDAANGSGLSRLMLIMLGLCADKVARACRLMAVAHGAPKRSGLSRLMLMMLSFGVTRLLGLPADAHDDALADKLGRYP